MGGFRGFEGWEAYLWGLPFILIGYGLYVYFRYTCALKPDPFDVTLMWILFGLGILVYLVVFYRTSRLLDDFNLWTRFAIIVGVSLYMLVLSAFGASQIVYQYNPIETYDPEKMKIIRYLSYAFGVLLVLPILLVGFILFLGSSA